MMHENHFNQKDISILSSLVLGIGAALVLTQPLQAFADTLDADSLRTEPQGLTAGTGEADASAESVSSLEEKRDAAFEAFQEAVEQENAEISASESVLQEHEAIISGAADTMPDTVTVTGSDLDALKDDVTAAGYRITDISENRTGEIIDSTVTTVTDPIAEDGSALLFADTAAAESYIEEHALNTGDAATDRTAEIYANVVTTDTACDTKAALDAELARLDAIEKTEGVTAFEKTVTSTLGGGTTTMEIEELREMDHDASLTNNTAIFILDPRTDGKKSWTTIGTAAIEAEARTASEGYYLAGGTTEAMLQNGNPIDIDQAVAASNAVVGLMTNVDVDALMQALIDRCQYDPQKQVVIWYSAIQMLPGKGWEVSHKDQHGNTIPVNQYHVNGVILDRSTSVAASYEYGCGIRVSETTYGLSYSVTGTRPEGDSPLAPEVDDVHESVSSDTLNDKELLQKELSGKSADELEAIRAAAKEAAETARTEAAALHELLCELAVQKDTDAIYFNTDGSVTIDWTQAGGTLQELSSRYQSASEALHKAERQLLAAADQTILDAEKDMMNADAAIAEAQAELSAMDHAVMGAAVDETLAELVWKLHNNAYGDKQQHFNTGIEHKSLSAHQRELVELLRSYHGDDVTILLQTRNDGVSGQQVFVVPGVYTFSELTNAADISGVITYTFRQTGKKSVLTDVTLATQRLVRANGKPESGLRIDLSKQSALNINPLTLTTADFAFYTQAKAANEKKLKENKELKEKSAAVLSENAALREALSTAQYEQAELNALYQNYLETKADYETRYAEYLAASDLNRTYLALETEQARALYMSASIDLVMKLRADAADGGESGGGATAGNVAGDTSLDAADEIIRQTETLLLQQPAGRDRASAVIMDEAAVTSAEIPMQQANAPKMSEPDPSMKSEQASSMIVTGITDAAVPLAEGAMAASQSPVPGIGETLPGGETPIMTGISDWVVPRAGSLSGNGPVRTESPLPMSLVSWSSTMAAAIGLSLCRLLKKLLKKK